MDDDPLVVPPDEPLRLLEDPIRRRYSFVRQSVDDLVVETYDGQLELRDNDILVVTGIANQGRALAVARQVVECVGIKEQLIRLLAVVEVR